ncbi:MAG: magnesium chelatase [Anaerolineae bacterium]|nr:magnesium chelatase [Anaerolineae bacterium]MCI0609383.1 magnesium chelatase [Anaerolineae bacterium]
MTEPDLTQQEPKERMAHPIRSLRELVDFVAGKSLPPLTPEEGRITEVLPFPYLAIVGQHEMKLALLLGLINPNIGGILLIGPRGTAKTTAVRSLLDLLPQVDRSTCPYGCLPEDIETGGIDAVCPDCAKKYGEGQPLTSPDKVRLIELPLNARIDDVVGGIDERAAVHERMRVRRGILAQADRNLLYIDEINLLGDDIIDSILDASAQGSYTVRRGPIVATYRSRFVLIGSMNPEEGRLRPQILDRFGLRVLVRGLEDASERLEAYRRVQSYLANPRQMIGQFSAEMEVAASEIISARERVNKVDIPDKVANPAIKLVQRMGIDSLRAEITWFESARAYAAADGRDEVIMDDLKAVAPMALRLRRSQFMNEYFKGQLGEEKELTLLLGGFGKNSASKKRAKQTSKKK